MIEARSGHTLVACNGCLIAIGGIVNGSPDASVEMLSDLDGTWRSMAPMNSSRSHFVAVECDGEVFAIGGKGKSSLESFQNEVFSTMEKYVFDRKVWLMVQNMIYPRWGHAACVFQGRILVAGGAGSTPYTPHNKLLVESYDQETQTWSESKICFEEKFVSIESSIGHVLVVA